MHILKGPNPVFPSRGRCHGVFLLSHAARIRERRSVTEWTQAACERSTFMSKALQLDEIARGMLGLGLAFAHEKVTLSNELEGLSDCADEFTLHAIARLLLKVAPPSWIWFAVRDGQIAREYIPAGDLENLAWIEPNLEQMLLDAFDSIVTREDDGFLKAMGDAAEILVFRALQCAGSNPLHVSRLSDSYGYDIECPGAKPDRIEVKAASVASQVKFHLSRNEYEKSMRYGTKWRLMQVVFSGKAFVSDDLNAHHIEIIRELRHGVLQELVPNDTTSFKWTESAQISPPDEYWQRLELPFDPNFWTPGFRRNQRN